jgi:hypothetical protein
MSKPTIIILRETVVGSWLRDAGSFAVAAGLIGVGVWVGSGAMQWSGFLLSAIYILARTSKAAKHLTIPQARALLDTLEANPGMETKGQP